jgi:hypothetical protein
MPLTPCAFVSRVLTSLLAKTVNLGVKSSPPPPQRTHPVPIPINPITTDSRQTHYVLSIHSEEPAQHRHLPPARATTVRTKEHFVTALGDLNVTLSSSPSGSSDQSESSSSSDQSESSRVTDAGNFERET